MDLAENAKSLHSSRSPPFRPTTLSSRKEKKKQLKEDRDKQKQLEKKRRRLEKALATSAAIRLELEKKKQRKKEEEQRLDEEGAALAEAVALHVLLDEDTDGVAHLETFAKIGFESLNILSGADQTIVDTSNCVSYFGPFHHLFSSGFTNRRSITYALINGGEVKESLHSSRLQDEFMESGNRSYQVAFRLGEESQKSGHNVHDLWEEGNNLGRKAKSCTGEATCSPAGSVAMISTSDKSDYKVETHKRKARITDSTVFPSLE